MNLLKLSSEQYLYPLTIRWGEQHTDVLPNLYGLLAAVSSVTRLKYFSGVLSQVAYGKRRGVELVHSSVRAWRSLYRHGAICSRKLLFPRTQSDDWMLKCGSHHRDKSCRHCFPLWLKQAVHFSSQNSQFCAIAPCTAVHFVIKWNSHISQAAFVHLCVIYWCHINKA